LLQGGGTALLEATAAAAAESLRDAGFATPCGGAGMWLLPCPRVAL